MLSTATKTTVHHLATRQQAHVRRALSSHHLTHTRTYTVCAQVSYRAQRGDGAGAAGRRGSERQRQAAARGGDPVPAAGPRDPGGAPGAPPRFPWLRRHLRQHRVRAPPDRFGRRRRRQHLRRRGRRGDQVRAGERRLPAGVRPVAEPRPVHGGRPPRPPRARRRAAAPRRRRRRGHHVPRRRHLLRLAGNARQEAQRSVRLVLDGAGDHLQPLLPHGPSHQEWPLQLQRAEEGHDHVRAGGGGDRAGGAHVVPAGDGHDDGGAPHHLQGVRGGARRGLRGVQHGGGAGAVHHRRAPRREAVLRCRPHPPRRLRPQRRRHLHVGGVRLLPVARRAAAALRALHLLRQLRARHAAGAPRDRPRRARQRRQVPVGDAAGHRQLRRPRPPPRRVRRSRGRPRSGGAVVLPGGGALPPRRRRLPDALRLELHPGERVGGAADAVLPSAHRPVHQSPAGRAGVARRRAHRRPRRRGRRRGEGEDRGGHTRGRRGAAPGAGGQDAEHAAGRRGARRLVAARLRRARRRAEAPLWRWPQLTRRSSTSHVHVIDTRHCHASRNVSASCPLVRIIVFVRTHCATVQVLDVAVYAVHCATGPVTCS